MIAVCVVDWCAAFGASDLFWCVAIASIAWLTYRIALLVK